MEITTSAIGCRWYGDMWSYPLPSWRYLRSARWRCYPSPSPAVPVPLSSSVWWRHLWDAMPWEYVYYLIAMFSPPFTINRLLSHYHIYHVTLSASRSSSVVIAILSAVVAALVLILLWDLLCRCRRRLLQWRRQANPSHTRSKGCWDALPGWVWRGTLTEIHSIMTVALGIVVDQESEGQC